MSEQKTNSRIKFIGKYNELKSLGYDFQKLYAGDYMQWSKGDDYNKVRVWKRGDDVTLGGRLTNQSGSFFRIVLENIKNGVEFVTYIGNHENESAYFYVYLNKKTDELFGTSTEYDVACAAFKKEFLTDQGMLDKVNEDPRLQQMIDDFPDRAEGWEKLHVEVNSVAPLYELIDLGWVELAR